MIHEKTVGIKAYGSKAVRMHWNTDGKPVRRKEPRVRMSKKERLKKRRGEVERL